jgi:hypothetical protein
MAYLPIAQEMGIRYELTGPDGTVAVFNDDTDPNNVGTLTALTGLDSPEIRENAQDLVESDGGVHGAFYFGRRPVTMTVLVHGHTTAEERAEKLDRLRRASLAIRSDCALRWTPRDTDSGSGAANDPEKLVLYLRRNQPHRESGAWNKEVQLALVSARAVIMSDTLYQTTVGNGPHTIENRGNYPSFPIIRISGVSTNPVIVDSNGSELRTTGLTVASGEILEIDTLAHEAYFVAGTRNGQSGNRYIDWSATAQWPRLEPGSNTFTRSSDSGTFQILWRHTWV